MATAQDLSAPHPLSDGDKELVPFSCCDCQKDPRRAKNSANNNGQHVPPSTPVERRPAEGLKFPRSRAGKANPEPPPPSLQQASPGSSLASQRASHGVSSRTVGGQLKGTYDQNGNTVPATTADPDGMIDGGGDDGTPLPRTAAGGHWKGTCDQNGTNAPATTADPDGMIDDGGDDDTPLPRTAAGGHRKRPATRTTSSSRRPLRTPMARSMVVATMTRLFLGLPAEAR